MKIGIRIPQYGATWQEVRRAAERIEALGFDGIWVNDHLQSPGRLKSEPVFDALTTLAALAPMTRARLGIAVLSASYRSGPLTAKMTSVLDTISAGRLVVGLGTGSDRAEHDAYQVPFGSPSARTEGLIAAFTTIKSMQDDPDGAIPNQPVGRPPLWLAAHKQRLLTFAGTHADGVIAAWVPPDVFAGRRAVAERARRSTGRGPIAYCIYTFAFAYPNEREGLKWLEREALVLATTPRSLLRWLGTTGIVGTIDEVSARLQQYADAGATDAVLALPSRTPDDALEALAATTGNGPLGPLHRAHSQLEDRSARCAGRVEFGPREGDRRSARANVVDLLVEQHRRAGRGDDIAVIDDGGTWTYDELDAASARAAGRLHDAGIPVSARVGILLPEGRDWCAAFLGVARLGAVAVPLEPGGRHREAILADLEPHAVICTAGEAPTPGIVRIDPSEFTDATLRDIAAVHPEDLAYMIFSSGSTGRPKGAMHAHRDLAVSVDGYAHSILGLGPGDRCHSVANLFASLGFGNGFFRPLGRGAAVVLSAHRPTVRSVLNAVRAHDVTVLSGVPTFWSQLATYLERHPDPGALSGVRLAVSSGDALPAAVGERIRAITGVALVEGLGCSECSNIVLSTRPDEPLPGTLGRIVPGVEIRLADDDGLPVPPGSPGRLWIKSPSNTTGYWRRLEETRDLVYGPWIRMGDVLREDDGVYRHLGRSDDLFKVDAKFVSPVEVESALHEHPAVAEAAVVGLADANGLTRVAAYVVTVDQPADPALSDTLRRHVAHRLAAFMAPHTVTFLTELPRGATGKVDRRALRELRRP